MKPLKHFGIGIVTPTQDSDKTKTNTVFYNFHGMINSTKKFNLHNTIHGEWQNNMNCIKHAFNTDVHFGCVNLLCLTRMLDARLDKG